MLAAFRLCGEIDLDGGGYYDEEAGSDPENGYDDEYGNYDSGSEFDRGQRRLRINIRTFPIRRRGCD